MKMNLCILLATLLCAITSCVGLPDGAPLSTCSSLLPHHNDNKPQQGRSPYTVSAEKIGSNKVKVTISSPTGDSFRGFILQARSAKDKSKFIAGEFKSSEVAKAIDCHNQKQSTLTHQDRELKTDVITEWTATPNEDVIFRATVVKSYEEYWQNTDSEPVKFSADGEMPSEDSNDHSEYDGCFKSKGCFGMPHRCVENLNCDVLFTYKENSGDLQFTMHGSLSSSEYMAMGLSEDNKMGDDLVTECFRDESDGIKLRNSWNEGQSNTRTKEANFDYLSVENGRTTCMWTELNITYSDTETYRTFDLFNNKYYVLLARGSVSNEKLGYHHSSKVASPESVNFFAVDSIEKYDVSTEPRYESTEERKGESTTAEGGKVSNSCSQLISSLLWLAFLGIYIGRRNMV